MTPQAHPQTPSTSGAGVVVTPVVAALPAAPAVSAASTPTSATAAVHGPYEDLAIAGIGLLTTLIKTQTPDVSVKLWTDWLTFMQGIQVFAEKADVLHLFHQQTSTSTK